MNVKEFKEKVAALPDNLDEVTVLHLRDPEGNGFNWSNGVSVEYYRDGEECPQSLDSIKENWEEWNDEEEFDEAEVLSDYEKVVLVW